ncbi:MAG: phosphoenolpyruvate carboxykinase (ATP), partial [Acidobacteria bacterium]|nr:phosphoenolpyruvate carboxykinase (ATP) [Acidobacteriota bacterium]
MSNSRETRYGNLNVQTRVTARSKSSTFIITDDPRRHFGQPTIDRAVGARMARMQDEYIRSREMIIIDGMIGNDPTFRVPARLIIESANANIAAMQQILYFPLERGESVGF